MPGICPAAFQQERQHSPVNQIRAVSLRRVFPCDIGQSAEHLLAAGGLLPRGAVARFYRINYASNLRVRGIHRVQSPDCGQHTCELRHRLHHAFLAFSGRPRLLRQLHRLGAPDIPRILPGKRKFRKTERIGTERGSFAGRDQLVRRGHRIMDHGHHL